MFFGNPPDFDEILRVVGDFESDRERSVTFAGSSVPVLAVDPGLGACEAKQPAPTNPRNGCIGDFPEQDDHDN
jgi:hypothetical protein